MDRLRKISREASEQSGRNDLMEISEPQKFLDALNNKNELNFFFDTSAKDKPNFKKAKSIGLFIGPEGGFTAEEVESAKTRGFTIASLGQTVLKAETAAICACFQAINQL